MRNSSLSPMHGGGVWLGLVLCAVGLSGYAASPVDREKLASANTGFAFRLLDRLAVEKPDANIFISPYSVSSVLQMVDNGAAGQTKKEMEQVLGTSGWKTQTLNEAYKDLDQSLRSEQPNVVLSMANAIWYSVAVQLRPEFVAVNRDFYGANLAALDFTDPRTPGRLNAWADENTHGKIKNIVTRPLQETTGAILANAIYFKGSWASKFDPKQTQPRAFKLSSGGEKQTPMMRQSGKFLYQEGPGFRAVRLPYTWSRLAMTVLLPDGGTNLGKLLAGLDGKAWQDRAVRQFWPREGVVILPRFKLEYGADMKKTLQALGMKTAFGGEADFSGVTAAPLFISAVDHKSFVEVNEEGTEAAAATVAVLQKSAEIEPAKPFLMIVDHPFLFTIEDNETRSILFMGVVFDPQG
jgi:serine protease inhibitor